MLQKSQIITKTSLREYGVKKGSYLLDESIVDFQFLKTLDYSQLKMLPDNPFCWVYDAVLDEFNADITYGYEEEIEDEDYEYCEEDFEDDVTEDEEEFEEDDEYVDEDIDEDGEESAEQIIARYIEPLPKEISEPLLYMLQVNGISYRAALCMSNLKKEHRFNIFKNWLRNNLIIKMRDNIIYREEFKTDIEDELGDIMEFIDAEKDYELIFDMLISFMYAYRIIFALIEHSSQIYNYIAERLFRIWDLMDDIFMSLCRENKEPLSRMADKIYDYLRVFKKHYGLSILDGKMYLTASIFSSNAYDEITEYLTEAPRNQISKRYLELAYYVILENQGNQDACIVYKNMDDTNKIILSDIYNLYSSYEQIIKIMKDVQENTKNKSVYKNALDTLEYVYEELDMQKELVDIYYQKLQNGIENVFSNICDYIYAASKSNNENELESVLETAKAKLTPQDYFTCLMKCGLYDKCINIIKTSTRSSYLLKICKILVSTVEEYEFHSDELNNFLKDAFEALSQNKRIIHDKTIRNLIEKYLN